MNDISNLKTYEITDELDRRDFIRFAERVNDRLKLKDYHKIYYRILDLFAKGEIKNLIITMPPQHGKSEACSRLLPSYILGNNPGKRIAIGSYAASLAKSFNGDVQQYIQSKPFYDLFPSFSIGRSKEEYQADKKQTQTEFGVVGDVGGLITVGRGGGISGRSVDIFIFDDLYKDSLEGNSPNVRAKVISWYTSAARKRLDNDSQQLVTFTRWHEDDLIGYIEENEKVLLCKSMVDIKQALADDPDNWIKVNFPALQDSTPSEFDSREIEQALWPEKHSFKKLNKERSLNENEFQCLNQGDPSSSDGLLYSPFRTYTSLPDNVRIIKNYTDTADTGEDFLCSVNYAVTSDQEIYVTDILYTQEPMEVTEQRTPTFLDRGKVEEADIESNNGGRGFGRVVQSNLKGRTKINLFHQSQNKESRILTNSARVNDIFMPFDWDRRFTEFYRHITKFKRLYAANKYRDCADVMTGVYEKGSVKKRKGVKRRG